ncbi:hypothetical protein F4679DRAFT_567400 [Xylaria curta]|nr:hypothetical protein F4679DRAFT_567400 [Xylaria curta]
MTGSWGWVTACAAVLWSLFFIYPLVFRIQRRNQESRSNGIRVISNPADAKFEIVAVHGLGAHPEHTWTCDALEEDPQTEGIHEHTEACDTPEWSPRKKIHLLRCLLKESFPEARILSFAYNSDWLIDAPIKTAQQIGERLHDQLVRARNERKQRLPIIFVGHSFGGIVIKQALCEALCASEESKKIVHDTSGILFLGTPHQGSPISRFGFIIAWATSFLGSSTGLLFTLRHHSKELTDLRQRFRNVYTSVEDPKVYSICETKSSYIFRYLSLGLIVNRDSAEGLATKVIDIDTDHSGLNKCPRPSGELYNAIVDAMEEMRRPSLLERGDKKIRDCYTPERLNIERLSGSILPMDQCYINLAIVQTNEFGQPSFRRSLLERLNIKDPDKDLNVSLSSLFEPRITRDEEGKRRPQRVLIRGRPGVGKTTLCKKIVHDFIHRQQWNDLFTRLLWIPLRNLENYQGGYSLTTLLREEFFPDEENPIIDEIYQELQKHDTGGTLFLLDGLDEIRHHLLHGSSLYRLVKILLKQPNVLVTSRPSVQLSDEEFGQFDLELETIGFYSDQVFEYVEHVTKKDETKEWVGKPRKINNFISQHPLIGDLVRIPIQLDALCFAWDDVSSKEPQTMTDLYQAVERGLWKKDAARLGGEFSIKTFHRGEIEQHVGDEIILLEKLAFAGLFNNLTIFDAKALDTFSEDLAMPRGKIIDETLQRLSFVRSSDVSLNNASRHYYFLHLTLQEYFAARCLARYFKQKWVKGDDCRLPGTRESLDATTFLCRYKYSEKFDVVWRFVAGLLSSDFECQTHFFHALEAQPLDLLGPAHQRLLMRCWFEIPTSNDSLRKQFENQLSKWLGFECDFLSQGSIRHRMFRGKLADEMEVPTGVLSKLLRESGIDLKVYLIKSIHLRRTVSTEIVRIAVSWLQDPPHMCLVWPTLEFFQEILQMTLSDGHHRITHDSDHNTSQNAAPSPEQLELIIQAFISQLEHSHPELRRAAIFSLDKLSNLPNPILHAVVGRLKDSDSVIQQHAIQILEKRQSNLGEPITRAVASELDYLKSGDRQAVIKILKGQSNIQDLKLQAIINALEDSELDRPPKCAPQEQALDWSPFDRSTPKERPNLQDLEPQALVDRLEDLDSNVRDAAIEALQAQSHLNEPILQAIVSKLENSDWNIRLAAIRVLRVRPNLKRQILQAIVGRLTDSSSSVRESATRTLEEQSNLEAQIIQAVVDKLADSSYDYKESALEILKNQSNLPDSVFPSVSSIFKKWSKYDLDEFDYKLMSILKRSPKLTLATFDCYDKFKGLFLLLLRRSFACHLAWYHYDNKLHLVIDGEVIEYEGEDPRSIIEEVVPNLLDSKQWQTERERFRKRINAIERARARNRFVELYIRRSRSLRIRERPGAFSIRLRGLKRRDRLSKRYGIGVRGIGLGPKVHAYIYQARKYPGPFPHN